MGNTRCDQDNEGGVGRQPRPMHQDLFGVEASAQDPFKLTRLG